MDTNINKTPEEAGKQFVNEAINHNASIQELKKDVKEVKSLQENLNSLVESQKLLTENVNKFVQSNEEAKQLQVKSLDRLKNSNINQEGFKVEEVNEKEIKSFCDKVNNVFNLVSENKAPMVAFLDGNNKENVAAYKQLFKKNKESKSYNSFNDVSGGYANALPVFGGLIDVNPIASSNIFKYCPSMNVGNVEISTMKYAKYDLSPVAYSNLKSTQEGTAHNSSQEVSLKEDYITTERMTSFVDMSLTYYRIHSQNQGLFNALALHTDALDKQMMTKMDSAFFHGFANKDGVLEYITKGKIDAVNAADSSNHTISMEDIVRTFYTILPFYRGQTIFCILSQKAYINLLFSLTSGSGEYKNAPYLRNGMFALGNEMIQFIPIDSQSIINPNSSAHLTTLAEPNAAGQFTAGDNIALVGNLQQACTYITSSSVLQGFTPIDRNTLATDYISMYKQVIAGFGILRPNALKVIKAS